MGMTAKETAARLSSLKKRSDKSGVKSSKKKPVGKEALLERFETAFRDSCVHMSTIFRVAYPGRVSVAGRLSPFYYKIRGMGFYAYDMQGMQILAIDFRNVKDIAVDGHGIGVEFTDGEVALFLMRQPPSWTEGPANYRTSELDKLSLLVSKGYEIDDVVRTSTLEIDPKGKVLGSRQKVSGQAATIVSSVPPGSAKLRRRGAGSGPSPEVEEGEKEPKKRREVDDLMDAIFG